MSAINTNRGEAHHGRISYWVTVGLLYASLLVCGVYLSLNPIEMLGKSYDLGLAFWLLVAIYTVASIRMIDANEHAALTVFRAPIKNIKTRPYPYFVPLFVCGLYRFPTNVQMMVIGQPRERPKSRNKDGNIEEFEFVTPPPGALVNNEPMRITTAGYENALWEEEESPNGTKIPPNDVKKMYAPQQDVLGGRTTFDPQVIVHFVVRYPCEFVRRVGKEMSDATALVANATKGTLQGYCGKRVLSWIINHIEDKVGTRLRQDLERFIGDDDAKARYERELSALADDDAKARYKKDNPVADVSNWKDPWGIDIQGVQISDTGLPYEVNKALATARAAAATKEATITAAEAAKQELVLKGEGTAKARELLLLAEATGLKKVADMIGKKNGALAAQLEAMKAALSKGDNKLFLVGGKFHELVESLTSALGTTRTT